MGNTSTSKTVPERKVLTPKIGREWEHSGVKVVSDFTNLCHKYTAVTLLSGKLFNRNTVLYWINLSDLSSTKACVSDKTVQCSWKKRSLMGSLLVWIRRFPELIKSLVTLAVYVLGMPARALVCRCSPFQPNEIRSRGDTALLCSLFDCL